MRIIRNKRIGRVLYLVEGDVDEVVLLEHIFNSLLGYHTVAYDKRNKKVTCLEADNDQYSKVFIVPMEYSAVSKISTSTEYIEYIYKTLKQYGLEKDECAKYLIFDRDRESNAVKKYRELMEIFKNSHDNDLEINGLLLVSYPCMQAILCECFDDETKISSSDQMKNYSKIYKISDIDEEKLLLATKHLITTVNNIMLTIQFDINNLDNMEHVNKEILLFEEDYFLKNHSYLTLSTILFSLIDLGIIEL